MMMLFGVSLIGCEEETAKGPNDLGGETNIPLTEVGNSYKIGLTLGSMDIDIKLDTIYISKNDNGIVTVKLKADISKIDPLLKAIVPSKFLDANGNIDAELFFKATSEGIQDFYYADGDFSKPFTIVKYDMNVGDSWSYTTKDGKTINRSITEKTGQDDWPFGFMLIKTIKTETTNPNVDGVSKVNFRTNHRFGLVFVEFVLTGGQSLKLYLYPQADL